MVSEVAHARGLTPETIVGHLERLLEQHALSHESIAHVLNETNVSDSLDELCTFFAKHEGRVAPVYAALGERFTYLELRIARLFCTDANTEH
jgi:hypothetical protein